MPMNDTVNATAFPEPKPIGTAVAIRTSMMNIEIKSHGKWESVQLPINAQDLEWARKDFKVWVKGKPTGPLDGSWGALMDWWMNDRRPEWKKFDAIDRCYLKYAVGLPSKRVRFPRPAVEMDDYNIELVAPVGHHFSDGCHSYLSARHRGRRDMDILKEMKARAKASGVVQCTEACDYWE